LLPGAKVLSQLQFLRAALSEITVDDTFKIYLDKYNILWFNLSKTPDRVFLKNLMKSSFSFYLDNLGGYLGC
jgi:hypothetical protein